MKDKEFYGSGKHPEAGSSMIKLDGQWYDKHSIDYLKSQFPAKPKGLNEIESGVKPLLVPQGKAVNHTGFSKSKVINDNEKSEREQQLDRLAILQNTEARLVKDLERTRSVIESIKSDLSI